jgi:hypothetical protein
MSHAMHNVGLPCFAISVSQARWKEPDIQRHATASKLVLSLNSRLEHSAGSDCAASEPHVSMAKAVSVPAAALLVLVACCSCCWVRGEVAREARVSLVNFLTVLAGGDGGQAARGLGWNVAVDRCGAGSKKKIAVRQNCHVLRQPQRVRRPRQRRSSSAGGA